ncbi:MAG: mechanosensitive ion channel protein MscS [Firmicutes bacterium HGW-Firmicutes-1]|jgi:miniconductance mechanosensitive channel|nr:MAG: mechanosensitive ion channel protein MscS [Firmicutes bacterium HGW-Firmicutes-1]
MIQEITKWIIAYGVDAAVSGYLAIAVTILCIILSCIIASLITNKIVLKFLSRVMMHNMFKWDDAIIRSGVFKKLSRIVPALVVYSYAHVFSTQIAITIQNLATIYIIITGALSVDALLNSIDDIYRTYETSKHKPIKGYLQVVKIFVYIIAGIVIIAMITGRNPVLILSGIGALSAVLILIFKDSLLGLVAGIQLSSNDMIRIGDWIEMPKYGADGDVIDISLNTVKVENFDKTITTIPTYVLVSDSFKNWRGMTQSGGRRIKRSIFIDITSITFCTEELLKEFKKIHYLTEYIQKQEIEVEIYNLEHDIDTSTIINGRHLTNIGVFRIYLQNYLYNHAKLHSNMVQMVRLLPPVEHGIPLEVYAFTNEIEWEAYERIQSDIFDHILAIIPHFGLRVFQKPTGHDLRASLGERK